MFDNSGEKKKVIAGLDYHAWPVHKDEVEDDKCAPADDDLFMHKLNQNLIQWEHDYYYFFNKITHIWCKVTKLTSLIPSPTTIEGKLFLLQKENQSLKKNFEYQKDENSKLQTIIKTQSKQIKTILSLLKKNKIE